MGLLSKGFASSAIWAYTEMAPAAKSEGCQPNHFGLGLFRVRVMVGLWLGYMRERERERERDICLFNNKVFGDSQRHKFN